MSADYQTADEKLVELLERALQVLAKVRYCNWPPGFAEKTQANAHDFDDVLVDAERIIPAARRKAIREKQQLAHLHNLKEAAVRVHDAFLEYGPVEGGGMNEQVGEEFDAALDSLTIAAIASGVSVKSMKKARKRG